MRMRMLGPIRPVCSLVLTEVVGCIAAATGVVYDQMTSKVDFVGNFRPIAHRYTAIGTPDL